MARGPTPSPPTFSPGTIPSGTTETRSGARGTQQKDDGIDAPKSRRVTAILSPAISAAAWRGGRLAGNAPPSNADTPSSNTTHSGLAEAIARSPAGFLTPSIDATAIPRMSSPLPPRQEPRSPSTHDLMQSRPPVPTDTERLPKSTVSKTTASRRCLRHDKARIGGTKAAYWTTCTMVSQVQGNPPRQARPPPRSSPPSPAHRAYARSLAALPPPIREDTAIAQLSQDKIVTGLASEIRPVRDMTQDGEGFAFASRALAATVVTSSPTWSAGA